MLPDTDGSVWPLAIVAGARYLLCMVGGTFNGSESYQVSQDN